MLPRHRNTVLETRFYKAELPATSPCSFPSDQEGLLACQCYASFLTGQEPVRMQGFPLSWSRLGQFSHSLTKLKPQGSPIRFV